MDHPPEFFNSTCSIDQTNWFRPALGTNGNPVGIRVRVKMAVPRVFASSCQPGFALTGCRPVVCRGVGVVKPFRCFIHHFTRGPGKTDGFARFVIRVTRGSGKNRI